jgi:hypothetical protein
MPLSWAASARAAREGEPRSHNDHVSDQRSEAKSSRTSEKAVNDANKWISRGSRRPYFITYVMTVQARENRPKPSFVRLRRNASPP